MQCCAAHMQCCAAHRQCCAAHMQCCAAHMRCCAAHLRCCAARMQCCAALLQVKLRIKLTQPSWSWSYGLSLATTIKTKSWRILEYSIQLRFGGKVRLTNKRQNDKMLKPFYQYPNLHTPTVIRLFSVPCCCLFDCRSVK